VKVGEEVVQLSRTEFDLLAALAAQPRVTLGRRQRLELVWGESWFGDHDAIDVHTSDLRRKLGDADYVRTVRGFGYRMGEG
jgi:DNA-binding response OmpR family regulator